MIFKVDYSQKCSVVPFNEIEHNLLQYNSVVRRRSIVSGQSIIRMDKHFFVFYVTLYGLTWADARFANRKDVNI